jgi:signal transduction histidine kinase
MIAYGLTYREYLELKVRERESAMAQAAQDRADLLATVAHEMRTPLTAALGTIDLARRDLDRGRTDRIVPWLGTARDALHRLSRLTADIARASVGEPPELVYAPLDLCEIVNEACDWAESAVVEKGLTLVREDTASAPTVGDACSPMRSGIHRLAGRSRSPVGPTPRAAGPPSPTPGLA